MNEGAFNNVSNLVPNFINIICIIGIVLGVAWLVYGTYLFFRKDKKAGIRNISLGLLTGTIISLGGMLIKIIMNYDFYVSGRIELPISITLFIIGIFLIWISGRLKQNTK